MQLQDILSTIKVRDRKPLTESARLFGSFASEIDNCPKLHDDVRDRAAYVFITGNFPSHLRSKSLAVLKQISRPYRRPSSLDGRGGHRMLHDGAVRILTLNEHEMVRVVREKIRQGYLIHPSRGFGTRNGYSKVFMFKRHPDQMVYDRIAVTIEGAIKKGWQ